MDLRTVDYKFAFKDGFSVRNCRLKCFSTLFLVILTFPSGTRCSILHYEPLSVMFH